MHNFVKANFKAKKVVLKVRNVTKNTHKQNIRELFKHNHKLLPRLDCDTRWGSTFLFLASMLLISDLLGQIALANKSRLLSDFDCFAVQQLTECQNLCMTRPLQFN